MYNIYIDTGTNRLLLAIYIDSRLDSTRKSTQKNVSKNQ